MEMLTTATDKTVILLFNWIWRTRGPIDYYLRENSQSILFSRAPNPDARPLDGKRLGQIGAIEALGMDMAFPIEEAAG